MKQHLSSLRKKMREIISTLSPSEYTIFRVLVALFIVTLAGTAWSVNQLFLVEVPVRGGSLTEGVVGAPRFVNPLLAASDADRDLTTLTYAGLMRAKANGTLVPYLAKDYTISDDGLAYTFTLRDDIFFHDGHKITAEDVAFTVQKAQDPALKSPKRASWAGVEVKTPDTRTVQFILQEPYSPFLQNTTLGILPKHIWKDADSEQFSFSQFNTKPVGSGPFEVVNIKRDASGVPSRYVLEAFGSFAPKGPFISRLQISFFANEQDLVKAFRDGEVDAVNAVSPKIARELARERSVPVRIPLPRTFAVFFNQNEAPLFIDKAIRAALSAAVDRKQLINEVLSGYGTPLHGPIPPGALGYTPTDNLQPTTGDSQQATSTLATTTPSAPPRIQKARDVLEKNGWTFDEEKGVYTDSNGAELAFSLSTSNAPELKEAGALIKRRWEELGARVELKVFEAGDLNQNVIRPRNYEALLFGEIVGRYSDLFAFWHSSQRNDPGLNIALYANIKTDNLLEEARTTLGARARAQKYRSFENIVQADTPAVFLYAPDFIYFIPERVKSVRIGAAATPAERFLNIHEWYVETDKIWRGFVDG